MRRRLGVLVVSIGALLALGAGQAVAGGTNVYADCKANPAALEPAIDDASPGSTIHVRGTCVGQFEISKDMTLVGKGRGATLDGNAAGVVVTVQGAEVTMKRLTIRNGRAEPSASGTVAGAGITNFSGVLRLYDVNVVDNVAGGGPNQAGGIGSIGNRGVALLEIHGGKIARNRAVADTAQGAGGVIVTREQVAILDGVSIVGNSGTGDDTAGGMRLTGNVLVQLRNVRFERNRAVGDHTAGGLQSANTSTATLHNVKFLRNKVEGDQAAGGYLLGDSGRSGSASTARAAIRGMFAVGNRASGNAVAGAMRVDGNTHAQLDRGALIRNAATGDDQAVGALSVASNATLDALRVKALLNRGTDAGGALANLTAALSLTNSLIAFNTALSGTAGGILRLDSATIGLARTTVARNRPNNCVGFALPGCL